MVSYNHKAYTRWCQIVKINEVDSVGLFYCGALFQCSKDASLQWFRYSIVHRIIPMNNFLYFIKVTTCNKCDLCHEYAESIEHLFYNSHSSKLENLQISISNAGIQGVALGISTTMLSQILVRSLIIILVKYFILEILQKTIPHQFCLLRFLKDYF